MEHNGNDVAHAHEIRKSRKPFSLFMRWSHGITLTRDGLVRYDIDVNNQWS
jgi:hypothetical protein